MADFSSWDLVEMKRDVVAAIESCNKRGLLQSAKWAAEMACAIEVHYEESEEIIGTPSLQAGERDSFALAKCYFDLREFDRAAHLLRNADSPLAYFLHIYARYMAAEKKRLDNSSDNIGAHDDLDLERLKSLQLQLHKKQKNDELDGYCLYIYGCVLKKLDLTQDAIDMFTEAVHHTPMLWAAWMELSMLIKDKDMMTSIVLPDHWLKQIFRAHTYVELQLYEDALKMYETLRENGLTKSSYVTAQIGLAYYNLRDVDMSVEVFRTLLSDDPYRLEHMDTYSNLLYVKEMRTELAHLAHQCFEVDKYRVETCCIIGNYYSLRSQHEMAVMYFERALKLNPSYLSVWTLIGHEYMELKNTAAAIQAYRRAIDVNRRDYRAWYGLGQTYEILKMPFYCLYYHRQAQMLRPNDSRMVVALGTAYEKLDRLQEAKKCFWKAHSIGDVEGLALIKLAMLYERLNEDEQAAAAYTEYINETEAQGASDEELCKAYRYLANYHVKHRLLDDAYIAAQKCTEFNETREEGKALLRQISHLRTLDGDIALLDVQQNFPFDTDVTPRDRGSPLNLIFHA